MDARSLAATVVFTFAVVLAPLEDVRGQFGGRGRMAGQARGTAASANFVVMAADQQVAAAVAQAAELYREQLAVHWLGQPLPTWPQKCPITVSVGEGLGASGATTFTLQHGTVGGWHMEVEGTYERVLDSVLPHEITHTVLATHFAPLDKHLPRWADEGACSTVEFLGERQKHDHFLVQFLHEGRGLPFATMFTLKEYPSDIMPLYAQGYSVTAFLIAQGGPRQFISFLESGMATEDWVAAVTEHYGYPSIGKLQNAWNNWVHDGGGAVASYSGQTLYASRVASTDTTAGEPRLASASVVRPASFQTAASQIATDAPATSAAADGFVDAASRAATASEPIAATASAWTPTNASAPASAVTRFETTPIPGPRVTALPRPFESVTGGVTIGPSVPLVR